MQVLVVGSGVLSSGWINHFSFKFEKIIQIVDTRKSLIRFENSNQLNRYLGHGGTSLFWHGVSPILSGNTRYNNFFFKYYGEFEVPSDSNFLYIPFRNFNRPLKTELKPFIEFIYDYVTAIDYSSIYNQFSVKTSSGNNYICDYVFVGINILDLKSIKFNFTLPEFEIFDHLQIFCGYLHHKSITDQTLIRPKRLSRGYIVKFLEFSDSILMLRPKHGFKLGKEKRLINFGNSKLRIIFDLIISLDVFSILDAISLKYGIFYRTEYYSVYLQVKVKYDYRLDNAQISQLLKQYESFDGLDIKKIIFNKYYSIEGNHQVGEYKSSSLPSNINIPNLRPYGWLKGFHHTIFNLFTSITN